jgi:hypothetical protein
MKKIFVIGAGTDPDAIERAKKILELKDDVEVVCVKTIEDVPPDERFKQCTPAVQEIYKISAPPVLPPMTFFDKGKKKKGHERPYKYHR